MSVEPRDAIWWSGTGSREILAPFDSIRPEIGGCGPFRSDGLRHLSIMQVIFWGEDVFLVLESVFEAPRPEETLLSNYINDPQSVVNLERELSTKGEDANSDVKKEDVFKSRLAINDLEAQTVLIVTIWTGTNFYAPWATLTNSENKLSRVANVSDQDHGNPKGLKIVQKNLKIEKGI
ncbi:hypothetical protein OSB04_013756 [Centaurea solstitialis]|uniref:Uncharacterized protein n=1 Tax=Centaurea solstitialis TaxID=347529 RepID=A0AA38WFS8_9ASTR|nr:hypothetical protein OSB04_013756 [Centaurea solstitialis]